MYLLNQSSFNVKVSTKDKRWKKHIKLEFDWNTAEANAGGQGQKQAILRVLHESLSGRDFELVIAL